MRAYERLLNYVIYPTMSDETSESTPSSAKQLVLSRALVEELRSLGLTAELDEYGYVYATLDANVEGKFDTVGFIAHVDTSDAVSDENIKPRIVEYTGGDILLNGEKNIVMKVSEYPYLESFSGKSLIVTDGTTLLGADDKAGIANIMTMLERLIGENVPHGKICIAFTPDEEIGRGADHFDVERFGADYAYTVDGGLLGELEYENFNAAGATVTVNGVSIHPGSAKDKMKNAARIACEFNSLLPEDEIPERTEGYEGFHHLIAMEGECECARLDYIIRDHSFELFEAKKLEFVRVAELMNAKYGEGTVVLELRDSYFNMREIIEKNMHVVDRAKAAMISLGVEPIVVPIRGGTDGARLSFMGLPCPNLSTGGANFHSRFEFACIEDMDKIVDILVKIARDIVVE